MLVLRSQMAEWVAPAQRLRDACGVGRAPNLVEKHVKQLYEDILRQLEVPDPATGRSPAHDAMMAMAAGTAGYRYCEACGRMHGRGVPHVQCPMADVEEVHES